MTFLRRAIFALLLTLGLVGGAATAVSAHSFGAQGPPHTHVGTCTNNDCYRWILANGAIMQGDFANLSGQAGYVGVVCSWKTNGSWVKNPNRGFTWNANGYHPYCMSPVYSGTEWSLRP